MAIRRLFLLVALVLAVACAGEPKSRAVGDILLVTLDTARADRFSYSGSELVKTPSVDRLAAEGTAFLSAFAPSPITLVSHATLMTGLDPPAHGVRNNGEFSLSPNAVTLAEALRAGGWRTAAFVGAVVLDSRYGLDQGFNEYDDRIEPTAEAGIFSYARRDGREVVQRAVEWLEEQEQERTFLWVHLYDPHAPYRPPEPERSEYVGRPYDGSIAYTDRLVGVLLAAYERLGRYDDSLVVVTSDHGEGLGEHGEQTHGVFVYDESIAIPLVMRGPGVPAGRRVESPVGLVDLMPTMLGLLGEPIPDSMAGRDLNPLMAGLEAAGERAIYIESLLPQLSFGWSPLRGLRTPRWKLIKGRAPELYDLEQDPDELIDLAGERAEKVQELAAMLARAARDTEGGTAEELEMDEPTQRQLAALGYLSFVGRQETSAELPDPRARIRVLEAINEALLRFSAGERRQALENLTRIAHENPASLAAVSNLAQMYFRLAEYGEAADAYGRAAELAPTDSRHREFQGFALEKAGRLEEALEAYEMALSVDPLRRGSRALRWSLLARLGRRQQLIRDLQQALEVDSGDSVARIELLRQIHGPRPTRALVGALELALAESPDDPFLQAALAQTLLATGERDRAEALYRKVLEQVPGDLQASLVVGRRALANRQLAEARRVLEAGVGKHPDRAEMQLAVAQARLASGDPAGARRALSAAARLGLDSADLRLTSAEQYLAVSQREAAERELDHALELSEGREELWPRLAAALREIGRAGEADPFVRAPRGNGGTETEGGS